MHIYELYFGSSTTPTHVASGCNSFIPLSAGSSQVAIDEVVDVFRARSFNESEGLDIL